MSPANPQLGRFEVSRVLGQGGMGRVYAAYDPELKREVAVKQIAPQAWDRLEAEATAAAALQHPGIVTVHELDPGRGLIVLELIEGPTLRQRLEEGPLPWRAVVDLGLELCQPLEHAAERGVVHRDLKPSNILFRPDGRAVIADFGLARLAQRHTVTKTGEIFGSPGYMAPEQATGARREWGPETDVYGLGATLYAALCGRAPFAGGGAAALYQVLHAAPAPPSQRTDLDLPRALETLIVACLAKEPGERPSLTELAAGLSRVRDGLSPARSHRRGRLIATVGSVTALVLMAVVLGARPRPPSEEAPPASPASSAAPTSPPASPSRQLADAAGELSEIYGERDPARQLTRLHAWLDRNLDHPRAERVRYQIFERQSEPIAKLTLPNPRGGMPSDEADRITRAAFSATGRLFVCGPLLHDLFAWEAGGELEAVWGHEAYTTRYVVPEPSGDVLLLMSWGGPILWSREREPRELQLPGLEAAQAAAGDRRGWRALSYQTRRAGGRAYDLALYAPGAPEPISTLPGDGRDYQALVFSPAGDALLGYACNDADVMFFAQQVRRWSLPDGQHRDTLPCEIGPLTAAAWGPRGLVVGTHIGSLLPADPQTGLPELDLGFVDENLARALRGDDYEASRRAHPGQIEALAFDRRGEILYAAARGPVSDQARSGDFAAWSWPEGRLLKRWPLPSYPLSLSLSPDGRYLALGFERQLEVWVYDVRLRTPTSDSPR